uniref:Uncharacterized protein n=1 Tax=Caenorhabditis japonica TaxID=281687 RepID=A0A8R1E6F3_CAEJA
MIPQQVHRCLENTIFTIFHETQCDKQSLERLNIELIDRCYSEAKVPYPVEFLERETQAEVVEVRVDEEAEEGKEEEEEVAAVPYIRLGRTAALTVPRCPGFENEFVEK